MVCVLINLTSGELLSAESCVRDHTLNSELHSKIALFLHKSAVLNFLKVSETMNQTPEETVKRMSDEIEKSSSALRTLNVRLRDYYDRLEVIYKQYRRRMPVKDLSFQEDFRSAVLELKTLAEESNDFWQNVRAYFRSLNKAELAANGRINIKQMNIII